MFHPHQNKGTHHTQRCRNHQRQADAENYYLTVKAGTCDLQQVDSSDANVTLIMDSETMQGIVSGETDGMQAFMGGKLRAEGDMMLALKLSELFPA